MTQSIDEHREGPAPVPPDDGREVHADASPPPKESVGPLAGRGGGPGSTVGEGPDGRPGEQEATTSEAEAASEPGVGLADHAIVEPLSPMDVGTPGLPVLDAVDQPGPADDNRAELTTSAADAPVLPAPVALPPKPSLTHQTTPGLSEPEPASPRLPGLQPAAPVVELAHGAPASDAVEQVLAPLAEPASQQPAPDRVVPTRPPTEPTEPPAPDHDEVTTLVTAPAAPSAEPPVQVEDETTTLATAPAAPDAQAAPVGRDDAATLVHASLPGPRDPPSIDVDEATTLVHASPPGPHDPPSLDVDEATTLVHASPAGSHPSPSPDVDEATTLVVSPDQDGVTTLVPASIAEDESTRLVIAPTGEPPTDAMAGDAWGDGAGALPDEPTTLVQTADLVYDPAPPTEHVPAQAAQGDEPTTIGGLTRMHGAPGTDTPWFDHRLTEFTQALVRDEAGQERTTEDCRALAAAARDMIARVAMSVGARQSGQLGQDAVLQPDQLMANTYFVRALIARGGVGEIYRARHRDLKTEHAVKILLPRFALDPTVLNLMLEEARLLQCVRHDAVVHCNGLLRDADGRPMLVMDYIRGRTLSARLREGPLSADDLMALTLRLAGGLEAIHAHGIVHQDISPDNIMLAEDSCAAATIIDFGLARRASDRVDTHRNLDFAGKYAWSSPEQLSGRPAAPDARADLYSLGLVLVAAARGFRLEMGHDLASARAARQTVPVISDVAEPMAGLLRRLLEPAPSARPARAADVPRLLQGAPPSVWGRLVAMVSAWGARR